MAPTRGYVRPSITTLPAMRTAITPAANHSSRLLHEPAGGADDAGAPPLGGEHDHSTITPTGDEQQGRGARQCLRAGNHREDQAEQGPRENPPAGVFVVRANAAAAW